MHFCCAISADAVLGGSCRHALDFRLMTDQRVAILDASQSLFKPSNVRIDGARGGGASKGGKGNTNGTKASAADTPNALSASTSNSAAPLGLSASTSNSSSGSSSNSGSRGTGGGLFLEPIPQFASITKEVVAQARDGGNASGGSSGISAGSSSSSPLIELVDINIGVICDASAVGLIAQDIHRRVVEQLKEKKGAEAAVA